jgi:hypothetical protein
MKRIVWSAAALWGFVSWADYNTALDCNELTFTTGGDANWYEQTSVKKVGESAMRSGSITDSQETWLQTTVTGAGMVEFWWKVSSESGYDLLEVLVDGDENARISGTDDWARKSVVVVGEGEHAVKWIYSKDSSESDGTDCGWLDAVSWTPVPESMTVTFETNGGDEIAPTNVAPGITYGELPVPQKEGDEEFVGWYLDEELTEKASSDSIVEFHDQTLYAKWIIPVSVLNADGLEFSTQDDDWCLPWVAVAEAGESGGYAVCGPIDRNYKGGYFYLWTTNCSGTLSYKYKVNGPSYDGSFEEYNYQNGDYYYLSDASEDWQTRTIRIYGDGESDIRMRWWSASSRSALMLSDFVWTPAPESMTITFETNGGDEMAPTNVAPGITYGELPVPQKEGLEEFGGWYLDEDLTEKASSSALVDFRDQTLYAKWIIPVSVMNADGLEFSTDSDYGRLPWEAVAEEGSSGGYALRGPISQNYAEGLLYLRSLGIGTLTYKWRIDGETDNGGYFYEYNYERNSSYGFGFYECRNGWQTRSVRLYGDIEEGPALQWSSSSRSAALMLSDIVWTPAPEMMTVSFDANGGTVSAAAREYSPGETYGRDGEEKLPLPTRKGFTFLGWRVGSADGAKVADGDVVPFEENIVLVARWGQAVSALNTKELTKFASSGDGTWYAVDFGEAGKGAEIVIPAMTKKDKYGDYAYPVWTKTTLQTTTVAAGYLSFDLSLATWGLPEMGPGEEGWNNKSGWIEVSILLDGKRVGSRGLYSYYIYAATAPAKTEYVYVPAGKHTLKLVAEGCPAFSMGSRRKWNEELEDYEYENFTKFGASPCAHVSNIKFEKETEPPDLQTWSDKVRRYKSWKTGELAKFASKYKTRMIADPEDYEARVLYAVTRLGALAENAQFKTYAKSFGFTIDWARMSVTPPEPKFDKNSAVVNAMADKTLALAEPVIKDVQAVLAEIPEDWSGTVTFSADEWPIDETTEIDAADVLFARAGLEAALAGLNYLAAHDLTVDWTKVKSEYTYSPKIPAVSTVPAIGDTAAWEKQARCFRTVVEQFDADDKGSGTGAMAVKGNSLVLRLAPGFDTGWLNETNQIRDIDFYIKSGDVKLNVYAKLYGEEGEWSWGSYGGGSCSPGISYYENGKPYFLQTNVTCTVTNWRTEDDWPAKASVAMRDGNLLLTVDMSKVNLGTKKKPVAFSKKSWDLAYGEANVGVWETVENEDWFEPYYDDEMEEWVKSSLPEFYDTWAWTGCATWRAQSDSERRVYKFISEQKAIMSKVRDASRLSAARRHFKAALETALTADGKAVERESEGPIHFFEYDPDDEAKIAFARNNTQRALAALDEPTSVNWATVAAEYDEAGFSTNKLKLADYDWSLLPGEGMTSVYLGALFEGRITRELMPAMRVNAYGDIVPDFEGMRDPTIGGLFPEMTADDIARMSARFENDRELDRGEHADPEALDALPKPGEKMTLDFPSYKGWTASGFPKDWKWDKNKGALSGTASATFTVTFKKGKLTATEKVEVGSRPAVLLFSDNEDAVSVTGTGLYNVGATVKAVAAVKNGNAFGGWYDGENLVYAGASYSFKMPRTDVALEARTVPLAEDELYAKPADAYPSSPTDNLPVGVEVGELTPYTVYSVSPATVTVSGLPPGLTAHVDEGIEDNRFKFETYVSGAPTKEGIFYATFTAKNNGGFRDVSIVKFTVGEVETNETNKADITWDSYVDGESEAYNYWFDMRAGCPFEAILDVPNSAAGSAPVSAVATKTVKKKTTSTLPPGLSATFKNGRITVSGVPSTPGKFTIEFTVTYKNKKTAKSVKTVIVKDSGSVYIPTGVVDNDPNGAVRGTVPYVGVKQIGQSVKFTASSKDAKKWFFGGWFLDKACTLRATEALPGAAWQSATLTAQIGEYWSPGDGMYARFLTKAEDSASIECQSEDKTWRVEYDSETAGYPAYSVLVESGTKATLTAKNMPAGTKLSGNRLVVSKPAALVPGDYTATLTATTASGVTATEKVKVHVANITTAVDKGILDGLSTDDVGYEDYKAGFKPSVTTLAGLGVTVANGWTLTVTGLPKGMTYDSKTRTFKGMPTKAGKYYATFTVTKGKTSYKATATFTVSEMQADTAGTYTGPVQTMLVNGDDTETRIDGQDGLATVSVKGDGTLSASLVVAGTKYSFTGSGLSEVDDTFVGKLTGKDGKKTLTLNVAIKWHTYNTTVGPDNVRNVGAMQLDVLFGANKRVRSVGYLYQSLWTRSDVAELKLPQFAEGLTYSFDYEDAPVTIKFGAKGAVTVTYTTANGANTGTACFMDLAQDEPGVYSAEVCVALPPKTVKVKSGRTYSTKKIPGLYVIVPRLKMTAPEAGGVVDAVVPFDPEAESWHDFGSWLSQWED